MDILADREEIIEGYFKLMEGLEEEDKAGRYERMASRFDELKQVKVEQPKPLKKVLKEAATTFANMVSLSHIF
jgi:hypothetical protein